MVGVVALGAAACSSTNSSTTTTAGSSGTPSGGTAGIPASAFSDHTGITSSTVDIANVATLTAGLFKGALVGTQAYAAYVNSQGGVNGRKLVVNSGDDNFTGAGNKQETENAVQSDFALVGGFSLEDSFGGAVLKANPGMPDVSVKLDIATGKLPNVFQVAPASGGWEEGPLVYFKQRFPKDIGAVGTLISDEPSAQPGWLGEKYVLDKLGYKVVYEVGIPVTQFDFTQNVIAMKNAGVKLLLIDQLPENYAGPLLQALATQNFHPQIILGAATYSNALIPAAGGAQNVNGALLDQNQSLFLGQDSAELPAVATFNQWVQKVSPGFKADLFTLYGWMSAELFSQALRNAGSDPSRGSLLEQLRKITSFDGDHIIAPADPVTRTHSNCYLLGQVVNGTFQRLDDPPVSGPTHGYRCDHAYVTPPGT